MKISEWLKQWDEGNFDFSQKITGDLHESDPEDKTEDVKWSHDTYKAISHEEEKLFNRVYPVISVIMAFMLIFFMLRVVVDMPDFGKADTPANSSEVIRRYVENGLDEAGAINIVASVILDYRAFDTLGESHVLFTASVVVLVLLLTMKPQRELKSESNITQKDIILQNTAKVLVPLIIMFGFYVILAGHLGPGGGFSGGSIIGGALILYSYAFGQERLNKIINAKSYKLIVLCALAFYSLSKCYSFFCGANHLETIFTTGTPGAILSAGLILPLNIAVGIVVACTMYGFYCYFTRGQI